VLLTTDSFEVHVTLRGVDGTRKKPDTTNSNNNKNAPAVEPSSPVAVTDGNNNDNNNNNNKEPVQAPVDKPTEIVKPTEPAVAPTTDEESKPAPTESAPAPTETKPVEAPVPVKEPGKEPEAAKPVTEPESTAAATTGSGDSPANYPFRYRGPPLDPAKKTELANQWGRWSLVDTKPRPSKAEVCGSFLHCDVPHDKFPAHAWQTDKEFLQRFLTQAEELVTRARETILAEYGESKFDQPGKSLEERSANFQLSVRRVGESKERPPGRREVLENAGWTTPRSYYGLVRRLLHAIVTQDTFTFVMGGHSAAAAHG
jgi:hypothetical protein